MAVALPHSVLFAGREYFALGGGDCAPDDVVESLDGTVASSAEFTLPEGCEVVRHDTAEFAAIQANVVAKFKWGCWTLALGDGAGRFHSYWTGLNHVCRGEINKENSGVYERLASGAYRCLERTDRLLVSRPSSDAPPPAAAAEATALQLPGVDLASLPMEAAVELHKSLAKAGVALPELGGAAAAVAPPPAAPKPAAAIAAAAAPNPDPDSCCAFVRSELATAKEELAAARAEAARLYDLIEKGKYALAGVGIGVLSAVVAVRVAKGV